jgi:hypothetical protein
MSSTIKITNELLVKTVLQIGEFLKGSFSNFKQYNLLYLNLFLLNDILFNEVFFEKLKTLKSNDILKIFTITAVCPREAPICEKILDALRSNVQITQGPQPQLLLAPQAPQAFQALQALQAPQDQQAPQALLALQAPGPQPQSGPEAQEPEKNEKPEEFKISGIFPGKDKFFLESQLKVTDQELKDFKKDEKRKVFDILDPRARKELEKLMRDQKNEVKKIVKAVSTGNPGDYTKLYEINDNLSNFAAYYAVLVEDLEDKESPKPTKRAALSIQKKEKLYIKDINRKAKLLLNSPKKISIIMDMIEIQNKLLKLLETEEVSESALELKDDVEVSEESSEDESIQKVKSASKRPKPETSPSPFFED